MYEFIIHFFQLMMQWLVFSLSFTEAAVEIQSPNTTALGNSQWEVVLSLSIQLGFNLARYSGLQVHCNITAIGFVWQVSCKPVWGLPADLDLAYIAARKICPCQKAGENWGKSKQQNCNVISLCLSLWRPRRRDCRKKSAFNHLLMSVSIEWVLYFWLYS